MADLLSPNPDTFTRTHASSWELDYADEGTLDAQSTNGSEGLMTADQALGKTRPLTSTTTDFRISGKFRGPDDQLMIGVGNAAGNGFVIRTLAWGEIYQIRGLANKYWNLGEDVSGNISKTISAGVDYRYIFEYVGGTLRSKIWADGGSEPGWDHEEAPATPYSNFTEVALISDTNNAAWVFDDLSVTDGDAGGGGPVVPVLYHHYRQMKGAA